MKIDSHLIVLNGNKGGRKGTSKKYVHAIKTTLTHSVVSHSHKLTTFRFRSFVSISIPAYKYSMDISKWRLTPKIYSVNWTKCYKIIGKSTYRNIFHSSVFIFHPSIFHQKCYKHTLYTLVVVVIVVYIGIRSTPNGF